MWYRQKTTWTGIAGIVAAVGGYLTDEIGLQAAIAGVIASLGIIFLRQSVAKIAPLLLVAVVGTSLVACGSVPGTGSPGMGGPTSDQNMTPLDVLGAYLNSGAMGKASETNNNATTIQPNLNFWMLFGKSKVTIASDGTTTAETEGIDASLAQTLSITPAITVGDCEGGDVSSGGGGSGAATSGDTGGGTP